MRRVGAGGLGLLLVIALAASACGGEGASSPGAPSTTALGQSSWPAAAIEGPITVGHVLEPVSALSFDLAANGYEEQEFFASGTAREFKATSSPSDGRWSIAPTTSAPYRTRILVRRPMDPSRFNGTVLVEWMNVSAAESTPDWDYLNPELMREGYAYVAVSAQALGVNGGTSLLSTPATGSSSGLIASEPARYGSLHHPGDQYSFDMFAQIGQAFRLGHYGQALGDLHPKRIVAVGESQSAFYLTTFADALQPPSHSYDAFLIHSRGGTGAPLSGASITAGNAPMALRIRTDLHAPVFMSETQTDIVELGYASARQPNTDRIRTWEIAGTSHADAYLLGPAAGVLHCTTQINDGPQHVVVQAVLAALDRWMVNGTQPPSPSPFRLKSASPPVLALDSHGNVIGGVRTPAVDVPVSTLSGAAPPGASVICGLFGSTTPFSQSTLASLYQSKTNYLAEFTTSLDQAIRRGFILGADRGSLVATAEQVQFS